VAEKQEFCETVERLCPPADRRINPADFVLESSEGKHSWRLRAGDLRLLTKNAIRGSGALANNAACIILLHRSRPVNNPGGVFDEDGIEHLTDTRARVILDKTRHGSKSPYVELKFDLDRDGRKAQYYDQAADYMRLTFDAEFERMVADWEWEKPGDPHLPVRPERAALAGFRY
jgi:hypothetical protein